VSWLGGGGGVYDVQAPPLTPHPIAIWTAADSGEWRLWSTSSAVSLYSMVFCRRRDHQATEQGQSIKLRIPIEFFLHGIRYPDGGGGVMASRLPPSPRTQLQCQRERPRPFARPLPLFEIIKSKTVNNLLMQYLQSLKSAAENLSIGNTKLNPPPTQADVSTNI
jgi:hypothetical protein